MMQFIKGNIALVLLTVLFVGGVTYYMLTKDGDTPLLTQNDALVNPASQELLALLGDLNEIALDDSIFTNEVFASLTDFGVVILPEPISRRNPFAPFTVASSTKTRVPIPGR